MIDDGVKLRKTTASIITEEKAEFLGLPGASIFGVLGLFAVGQVVTHRMSVSLLLAGSFYGVLRFWLRGKPAHYFGYFLWQLRAPKKYRHRLDKVEPRPW